MAFNLKQWARDFELEEATMDALADKGFKSKLSISLLTATLIKQEFPGLVMKQQSLLINAVTDLYPQAHEPPANGTPAAEGYTGIVGTCGGVHVFHMAGITHSFLHGQ